MTEEQFDAAMSRILAAGIRRAATSQIKKSDNVNLAFKIFILNDW